jgi:hypothetical protein
MLSDSGLVTFNSTDPPAWAMSGVVVIETGWGSLVRLTVEVETPQPWSPSATHASAAREEKALPNE